MEKEIKEFDFKAFVIDMYAHRTSLGLSRDAYAKMLGLDKGYPLDKIEQLRVKKVPLQTAYAACRLMGRNINDYFK